MNKRTDFIDRHMNKTKAVKESETVYFNRADVHKVMVKIVYKHDSLGEDIVDKVESTLVNPNCIVVNRGDTAGGDRFFFYIGAIGYSELTTLERNMLEYAFDEGVKYNLSFLNA